MYVNIEDVHLAVLGFFTLLFLALRTLRLNDESSFVFVPLDESSFVLVPFGIALSSTTFSFACFFFGPSDVP